MYMGSFYRKVV